MVVVEEASRREGFQKRPDIRSEMTGPVRDGCPAREPPIAYPWVGREGGGHDEAWAIPHKLAVEAVPRLASKAYCHALSEVGS